MLSNCFRISGRIEQRSILTGRSHCDISNVDRNDVGSWEIEVITEVASRQLKNKSMKNLRQILPIPRSCLWNYTPTTVFKRC